MKGSNICENARGTIVLEHEQLDPLTGTGHVSAENGHPTAAFAECWSWRTSAERENEPELGLLAHSQTAGSSRLIRPAMLRQQAPPSEHAC